MIDVDSDEMKQVFDFMRNHLNARSLSFYISLFLVTIATQIDMDRKMESIYNGNCVCVVNILCDK